MHPHPTFPRGRLLRTFLAFVFALVAGLAWSGPAWLLMAPALFMLGLAYGAPAQLDRSAAAQYGVGAALAGFTPPRK